MNECAEEGIKNALTADVSREDGTGYDNTIKFSGIDTEACYVDLRYFDGMYTVKTVAHAGALLKGIRSSLGLTSEEASVGIGVSSTTLWRIEEGRTKIISTPFGQVVRICKFYGIRIEDMYRLVAVQADQDAKFGNGWHKRPLRC